MNFERTLDEIVDIVQKSKEPDHGSALLIGAGCSVTAGIPAAAGVIERVKKEYPNLHECAEEKTYAGCMGKLGPGQRKKLITEIVKDSKINWCHIAIAQLLAHGFVSRVLTTNFDSLVSRACSLINEYPAIYDFANPPEKFRDSDIYSPSVIHLHGQYTGFALRNTREELLVHARKLKPLVADTIAKRPMIVIGYSGENDPVFESLAEMTEFDFTLTWVCYKDAAPPKHVTERLLQEGKSAYYVQGYDADDFFVELAMRLGCFPPTFVNRPFTHLRDSLKSVAKYRPPREETASPILNNTFENLRLCIRDYEEKREESGLPPESQLWADVMAGRYKEVIDTIMGGTTTSPSKVLKEILFTANFQFGNTLFFQAKGKTGDEAVRRYALACEKYEAAVRIKPDKHEALYNWGIALFSQAKTKTGAEAERLYALACEKYEAAVRIKPDMHEAFSNWGSTLGDQAKTKTGAEAERLYTQAAQLLSKAESLFPGYAAYNLACLAAVHGDTAQCRRWLEASLHGGRLPSREHIGHDSDLDSVRNLDWFKEFLAKLPEQ